MKKIPLTHGKFALVDDEDFDWLNQWKWSYRADGYAVRGAVVDGRKMTIRMHRLILGDELKPGLVCDHKNRNGLDNRRENLRACTRGENQCNRASERGSSSRFLGVSARGKKWKAQIKADGKNRHLGVYPTEEDAAIAYNRMAAKHFGEFANLNPVVDDGRTFPPIRFWRPARLTGAYTFRGKWRAQIRIGNKHVHLGCFDTELEAHQAYLNARQKLYANS